MVYASNIQVRWIPILFPYLARILGANKTKSILFPLVSLNNSQVTVMNVQLHYFQDSTH